jgi:hypothetical protein
MGCLQQWFNTPNGANEEIYGAMPVIRRKKTCPHCRTPVVQRPVAAHLLKALTNEVQTGWAALTARTPPVEGAIVQGDPWKDIFPSERNGANRGGDGAIIDHEDGGVRRCAHCLTEIYHGVCEGCGEEYDVEDYLSDESLEFGPYPAQRLRPLLYRDNFIVDGDAPPQRWREVYDDEEDGELDEYEEDFINDGDIDHMEGEDDGYHSEEPRRGPVRFEMPLPTHNRDRYVGAIVVEDSEDDDEDEDEEEIIPHPALNPRRRVAAIVVSDDDEESVVCNYESSPTCSDISLNYSKRYSLRTKIRLQHGWPCVDSIYALCGKKIPRRKRRMKIQCRLIDSCNLLGQSIPGLSTIICKPLLTVGCVKDIPQSKKHHLMKRSGSSRVIVSIMRIRRSRRIHTLKRKPCLILRTKARRESSVP